MGGGEEFHSLFSAAMAAAKDLGIKGAINGWIWWGITKPTTKILDPVEALAIAGSGLEKPVLVKVFNALEVQASEIAEISSSL